MLKIAADLPNQKVETNENPWLIKLVIPLKFMVLSMVCPNIL
jgi:hypothetical protein